VPPKDEAPPPTITKASHATASEPVIEVRGTSDLLTTLAKCCKPIRGDEIIGFISRGRGLSIHRTDCPNFAKLGYNPDRLMQVSWGAASASAGHDISLDIKVEDKAGVVAAITQAIADAKAPLRSIEGNTNGKGEGAVRLTMAVRDKTHLNGILTHLAKLPGIREIHRRNR